MSVYDVDFSGSGLPRLLLPARLRGGRMRAWLQVLCSPVAYLYWLFKTNRADNIYVLSHNSQVCYLEAALNDVFDPTHRTIQITEGPYIDPGYIYVVDEDKPLFIDLVTEIGTGTISPPDPVALYTNYETYTYGYQFVVNVPYVLHVEGGKLARLRAIVDKYRLVSKNNYAVVIV